jgi:PAS domain S-box-containing protein
MIPFGSAYRRLRRFCMIKKDRLFLRNSLGGQVMSLLSVALLSTLVIFSLSVFYFVNRAEKEAWQGRQSEAVRNAAGVVSSFIQRVEDSLLILSIVEPDHHVTDPDELQALLDQNQSLLEVVRTDATGTVIAEVHRDGSLLANLITIPQSQWFLKARAGQPYIGDIQLSANNEPYLIMSVPSAEGGVVAARVQMNVLWDVVKNIHFGTTGRAYVITRKGRIIAHTNAEIVLNNTSIQDRPEFITLMAEPDHEWFGTFESFDGKTVVGRASTIKGTDWLIMTELPWTEAYQSTRRAIGVLGTEVIILLLVTSWLIARRVKTQIMEPMEILRKGTEEIGRGNLSHRLEMNRQDEIGQVAFAFNSMARNLQQRDAQVDAQTMALSMSEERYRAIVEDQTELICRFLPDGTLTFVNEAYCRYFGKPREELIGYSFSPLVAEEDKALVVAAFNSLDKSNQVVTYEHRVVLPDGSLRWQQWTDRLVFFESGKILEYASVGRDITERKKAEDELRRLNLELEDRVLERTEALSEANRSLQNEVNERSVAERQVLNSLQEKEVLLKEIHHRVKNNLQIVSSLLNLQTRAIEDASTLQAMRESQMRIRSMALIHEKLYQSPSLASIDFGEYVRSLTIDLFRTYRGHAGGIQLKIEVDEVFLSLDHAVSCGLILNELMTNALKYAFPDGRNGTIWVELHGTPEHMLNLRVADDGVGIPVGFDVFNTKTLGLQLVNNLVRQLDATIEVETSGTTSFLIAFRYQRGDGV